MLSRLAPKLVGVAALSVAVSRSNQQRPLRDANSQHRPNNWRSKWRPPFAASSLISHCDSDKGLKFNFKWRPDVSVGDAEANYNLAQQYLDNKHPKHRVSTRSH